MLILVLLEEKLFGPSDARGLMSRAVGDKIRYIAKIMFHHYNAVISRRIPNDSNNEEIVYMDTPHFFAQIDELLYGHAVALIK